MKLSREDAKICFELLKIQENSVFFQWDEGRPVVFGDKVLQFSLETNEEERTRKKSK